MLDDLDIGAVQVVAEGAGAVRVSVMVIFGCLRLASEWLSVGAATGSAVLARTVTILVDGGRFSSYDPASPVVHRRRLRSSTAEREMLGG